MTTVYCNNTMCKHCGAGKICTAKSIQLDTTGHCSSFKAGKKICSGYHERIDVNGIKQGVCWGTKECDRCYCSGDIDKCDFYEKGR